jgi:hypothetical protein
MPSCRFEVAPRTGSPRRTPFDDKAGPKGKHQRTEGDSESGALWQARIAEDEVKDQSKESAAAAEA